MSNAISVCHGEFGRAALYDLDKPIITHAHREGHLIFYIDGGNAEVTVDGRTAPVNKDLAAAVSPWEPHSFVLDGPEDCLCLVLYIKPIWFLENNPSAEYALQFGKGQVEVNDHVRKYVRLLTSLLLDGENRGEFDTLLFDLTSLSFEQTWAKSDISGPMQKTRMRFNDFRVRRSLRLMQECISSDVEMESLARKVGLSRPHFFKLFKKQMGVTPNIYLNTLRSEQAIEDLLHTEKSVTDIAYDLGFSSQASFTRFFSSNVGIAPSEYRRVAHRDDVSFPMTG